MPTVATTRMSSKGQVVIPEEIRNRLGLDSGSQFVVVAEGNVVILRALTPLLLDKFDDLIATAHSAARRTSMKKSDIKAAIASVRGRRVARRSGK